MEERVTVDDSLEEGEEMMLRYKNAVERVIPQLPVKNGVVDIDAIWIETSLPLDLLRSLLRRGDLKLPENVERVNLKSRVPQGDLHEKGGRRRRREVRD